MNDCADETYKSRHSEKRKKYQLQGDCLRFDGEESLAGYSEVTQPSNFSEADKSSYSDPDAVYEHTFTSHSGVSLQPKVSAAPS